MLPNRAALYVRPRTATLIYLHIMIQLTVPCAVKEERLFLAAYPVPTQLTKKYLLQVLTS